MRQRFPLQLLGSCYLTFLSYAYVVQADGLNYSHSPKGMKSGLENGTVQTKYDEINDLEADDRYGNRCVNVLKKKYCIDQMFELENVDAGHKGKIPARISLLTNLKLLDLSRNEFHGEIPEEIGLLTSLTELNLAGNKLTGSLPISLGYLTDLKVLSLNNNKLVGSIPIQLKGLKKLEVLELYSNSFQGSFPFYGWPDLRELRIGYNKLSGSIPPIGNANNLRYSPLMTFNLQSNYFTGTLPPQLGLFGSLVQLKLGWNEFHGTIPSLLGKLQFLRTLLLHENRLSGSLPEQLAHLNLESFSASGTYQTVCLSGLTLPFQHDLAQCTITETSVPTTSNPTTELPTVFPTAATTTFEPSWNPTFEPPTYFPTPEPTTGEPSWSPTSVPPTNSPTPARTTVEPSWSPTSAPPTSFPSPAPTTVEPSWSPTSAPPTNFPTPEPITMKPSWSPTPEPQTNFPTSAPTIVEPSLNPTYSLPTMSPSSSPTAPVLTLTPTGHPLLVGNSSGSPKNIIPQSAEDNFKLAYTIYFSIFGFILVCGCIISFFLRKTMKQKVETGTGYMSGNRADEVFVTGVQYGGVMSVIVTIIDVVTDILLATQLFQNEGTYLLGIASLFFIAAPVTCNIGIVMLMTHDITANPVSRQWIEKNDFLISFVQCLSIFSVEILALASSGIGYFTLPLRKVDIYKLRTYSMFNNILEDIPQLVIVMLANAGQDKWLPFSIISILSSFSSLIWTVLFRFQACSILYHHRHSPKIADDSDSSSSTPNTEARQTSRVPSDNEMEDKKLVYL